MLLARPVPCQNPHSGADLQGCRTGQGRHGMIAGCGCADAVPGLGAGCGLAGVAGPNALRACGTGHNAALRRLANRLVGILHGRTHRPAPAERRPRPRTGRASVSGSRTLHTWSELGFYAAGWYSLSRPPRTARRVMRGAGWVGIGRSGRGGRSCRPRCGRWPL
jgi:hypothetical protein